MKIVTGTTVLRPLKTSESVARDIVQDVVADLGEGDSLPSEARMLEQYGVSRESLREGLRLLEAQGLITLRRGPGGGPVVGTVDPANLGRVSTLYYYLVGANYGELFEAWAVAEGYLAERAARNEDRELVRTTLEPYLETMTATGSLPRGVRHPPHRVPQRRRRAGQQPGDAAVADGHRPDRHAPHRLIADPRDVADILRTTTA